MRCIKTEYTGNVYENKSNEEPIIYKESKSNVVDFYSKKFEIADFNNIDGIGYDTIFNLSKDKEYYKIFNKENFFENKNGIGEEAFTLDNDKQNIRDAENRIHQAESRLNESEKRIYNNNKDMEQRIDSHFNDLKDIFKEYKNDIKEEISKQQRYNEESIKRIEENISKVETNIDSTNKWIIGLCITTILGIATIAITVLVTL